MEEVCGRSIPQLEQGGKRPRASKVCSPTVLSVSWRADCECNMRDGLLRPSDGAEGGGTAGLRSASTALLCARHSSSSSIDPRDDEHHHK